MAATVAGASPPARRSPRNGLPPSWSADEVYAHARAEWNNTDNALKEVPPSSWPWTMWANELHKSYAKKDGVAEAELQNLDTGTAERLGEELRRLVLAKAAVVRGGQLVDAFANAAAKPDAPAKRKLSVLENALTVLKAPKADDRARRRKVSSVKSSAARGPAASKKGKASTLSKIKPEQRILEHPDQGFIVDPNDKSMLYCQPCKGRMAPPTRPCDSTWRPISTRRTWISGSPRSRSATCSWRFWRATATRALARLGQSLAAGVAPPFLSRPSSSAQRWCRRRWRLARLS